MQNDGGGRLRLSILDHTPVSSGSTLGDAFWHSTRLAELAEQVGYERYYRFTIVGSSPEQQDKSEVLTAPSKQTSVPGGGVEPPRAEARRILSCDATLLQLLRLQQFLRLAFDGAARLVRFGVVSCRPVAQTLRTPLRVRVDRIRLRIIAVTQSPASLPVCPSSVQSRCPEHPFQYSKSASTRSRLSSIRRRHVPRRSASTQKRQSQHACQV